MSHSSTYEVTDGGKVILHSAPLAVPEDASQSAAPEKAPRVCGSIEAVQRTHENLRQIFDLIAPPVGSSNRDIGRDFLFELFSKMLDNRNELEVPTADGIQLLPVGWWLIRIDNDQGSSLRVMDDDEFRKRYL